MKGRTVLLGVTGGIAAYKAVELSRLLIKGGARVQVIMTEAATKFVAPLSFESITGRRAFVNMFPEKGEPTPWHTELSTQCDLVCVAPATADHMAKLAHGFADDLLSATLLACEKPRVICPAMNPRMWANPATQENLKILKRRGFRVIPPEEGEMARPGEDAGIGRLAEPETIFRELKHMLSAPQDLKSVQVLVTAGRTEESWDPVRVLTNRASGRMGFALAEEARERGADVVLIHGPTDVVPPTGVRRTPITSAREMTDAVMSELPKSKIVLMSAAVSDYTFESTAEHKIKKGDPDPEIKLTPTTDILKSISAHKGDRIVVGFALETENVLENALKKLRDKHLDIVVANNPLAKGSGFQKETNQVFIIHRGGRVIDLPLLSKREVARTILDAVLELYKNPEPEPEPEPDLDLEMNEGTVGNVHLEGLDIVDEQHAEEPHAEEPALNGKSSKRTRGRRGGRRVKRNRERQEQREQEQKRQSGAAEVTESKTVPVKEHAPASVTEAAVEEAVAAPAKKTTRKRATKKSATKQTATKQTTAKKATKKTAAKKTTAKKTATKKSATKKTARKTTRKKAAPAKTEPVADSSTDNS